MNLKISSFVAACAFSATAALGCSGDDSNQFSSDAGSESDVVASDASRADTSPDTDAGAKRDGSFDGAATEDAACFVFDMDGGSELDFVAPPGQSRHQIFADSTSLSWIDEFGLETRPKPCGPISTLVAASNADSASVDDAIVESDFIFWVGTLPGDPPGSVYRTPRSGGSPTLLTPSSRDAGFTGLSINVPLSADSHSLYAIISESEAVDGSSSFVTTYSLASIDKTSGALTPFGDLPAGDIITSPHLIAADDSGVYVWTGTHFNADDGSAGTTTLYKIDSSGVSHLLATGADRLPATGGVLDATSVYWFDDVGENVSLMSLGKAGGAITPLAAHQDYPESLAISGGFLYWITDGVGASSSDPDAGSADVPGVLKRLSVSDASSQPTIITRGFEAAEDSFSKIAVDDQDVYFFADYNAFSSTTAPTPGYFRVAK